MIIAGEFSFNGGKNYIEKHHHGLLNEIKQIILAVNANEHKLKKSREKTMPGRTLFSPIALNKAFKAEFISRNWQKVKVQCDYPTCYYTPNYKPKKLKGGAFREMDFVKDTLGVEVQFGKYAFMVYNVCAKMTIFNKLRFIDSGIEIVPIKQFADEMSTGVSYFEQFVWDLEKRGIADIDIPVLVLGIDN
jgi:hypothetical protein